MQHKRSENCTLDLFVKKTAVFS